MKCPKCDGLMFAESILEFYGVSHIWKCINCGALIDHIILENRRISDGFHLTEVVSSAERQKKAALSRSKKMGVRTEKEAVHCAS